MKMLAALLVAVATVTAVGAQQSSTPAARQRQVTFTKDVAPILQRSCQTCHRPGAIAPMSLLTYQDARPWARSIRQKVVDREMPPWHIDRNVGITKFKDDPSLTDAEIATIASGSMAERRWATRPTCRAARSSATSIAGTSASPTSSSRWTSPTCSPPDGPDNIVDVLVDPGFKEDMYVMAIESKPADAKSFKVRPSLHDQPGRGSRRGSGRALPERIRARQERRHLPAELGTPHQGRDEDQLQPASEPARRRNAGVGEAGAEGLPERAGAEVRRVHAAHGRRAGPRHPAGQHLTA